MGKVFIDRGTAVIARPGVGVQFNVLPHNAIVLPLPRRVSPGQVMAAMAAARLPLPVEELTAALNFCGLGPEAAEDIVDELLRCGVLREFAELHSIPVLKSGTASDRLVAALRKEGLTAHSVDTVRTAISSLAPGAIMLLPGNMFLPADSHYLLMQARINHLPSAALDGAVVIGPLVVPGETPCLNCVDRHYGARDAQWNGIRSQAAGRPSPVDQLHNEAASLAMASIVARHLMPWHYDGRATEKIPNMLRQRMEIRLGDAEITRTEIPADAECLTCQMTRSLPGASSA